ncbi:hypothetical protein [Oceanispirochaeta sp.]|uniref:hypothetical protein n=1 Tax=Oceanispirochaeta sp. TaxID=2035350 RepID=UPI002611DDD7|nr:hypothetical protein [Oceanispirochaeta sp.]MDA3955208.1 hypothetical protein [Oceanispirochaeta sp.]
MPSQGSPSLSPDGSSSNLIGQHIRTHKCGHDERIDCRTVPSLTQVAESTGFADVKASLTGH